MSLSLIANSGLFASNPFLSAIKIATITIALNAIQSLGILAASIGSKDSHITSSREIQFLQESYSSRVQLKTEKLRSHGREWFWPQSAEDWAHMDYERKDSFIFNTILCPFAWALGPFASLIAVNCAYFKYYNTFLDCKSDPDLMGCVMSDPQKRAAIHKSLADAIETVLPINAEESKNLPVEDCFSSTDCPDIARTKIHPREKKAAETAYTTKEATDNTQKIKNFLGRRFGAAPEWSDVQEVLRFRSDDPREKFLFISAEADHNGALNPPHIAGILGKLAQKYDLKFQVVKNHSDICQLIDSAKKTGNLAYVLIHGHGEPRGIVFNEVEQELSIHDYMLESDHFASCFSGLNPNGKILLVSCSTGGMKDIGDKKNPIPNGRPFDNIAQAIADDTKRIVIAPKDTAHSALIDLMIDDNGANLYETDDRSSNNPFYNTNLFEAFRPHFTQCSPEIDNKNIHDRELIAMDVIRKDLIENSLLHDKEAPDKSNEFVQLCKDDPREKAIVLSAQHEENGALNPAKMPKMLRVFADRFDLRYKVVQSFEEICREVENAAKVGKVKIVVIHGSGTSAEGIILSTDSSGKKVRMNGTNDFSKCFSGLDKDGTIVLMGGSLGQNGSDKNNIAQKIANDSQRKVIAATCPVFSSDVTIPSIDPFVIKHPAYSWLYNFFRMWCWENNDNHFKTFQNKEI